MDANTRRQLQQAQQLIREILAEDTVEIEVELEDSVAAFCFAECARRNITPSELIVEIVNNYVPEMVARDESWDDSEYGCDCWGCNDDDDL